MDKVLSETTLGRMQQQFSESVDTIRYLQGEVSKLEAQARGYRAVLRSAAQWLSFNTKPPKGMLLRIQINDALEGKYLDVPTKEVTPDQGSTEERGRG